MRRRAAQPEGILTTSGLLYEGNFNDWQRRVSAVFIVKGKRHLAYPAATWKRYDDMAFDPKLLYQQGSPCDLTFLMEQVSPALLARIPSARTHIVGQLYAALKKLCLPFRLMELPPELRVQIVTDAAYNWRLSRPPNRDRPWVVESLHPIPALMHASRVLRKEVLPLYFANCTFFLNAKEVRKRSWTETGYHTAICNEVRRWASSFLGTSVASLRKVTVVVGCERQRIYRRTGEQYTDIVPEEITLLFSEADGLRVKYSDDLTAASKAKIDALVARVEAERKDAKGQSILTAILGGPSVFGLKHLRMKDLLRA